MRNLLFIVLVLCIPCMRTSAQEIKTIKLKSQSITYAPTQFHIAGVVDDRSDTTNIGTILDKVSGTKNKLTLQNGVAWSVADFYRNNVKLDTATTPITIHITDISLSEKVVNAQDQADLSITFVFYYGNKKIVKNTSSSSIQAIPDVGPSIEGQIRQRLENMLKDFDKFWKDNKRFYTGSTPLSVDVQIINRSDDPDLILYSKQRPLTLDDFQGVPENMETAVANTSSGIGMNYSSETMNGKITLKVSIMASFDKSRSWCKSTGRNAHTLAHEQIHFDISALKACELINAIKTYSFSSDNYAKELEELRKQSMKETEQMDLDYDKETEHGTIESQQKKWNDNIKKQLAVQTCF